MSKKYIRKIPEALLARIELTDQPILRVGNRYALNSPECQAVQTRFRLTIQDDEVHCEDPLPAASNGSWSRKNALGWEEVHRDRPKEPYSYWIHNAPTFGDRTRTHSVHMERERCPRTLHGARLLAFQFRIVEQDEQRYLECHLEQELELASPTFRDDLFFQLNLYCENCGNCDVLIAEEERHAPVQRIQWEVFPTMPLEEVQELLTRGVRDPERQEQIRETVAARYRFFRSLSATRYIVGADAFTRYFGAVFNDRAVLFECVNYGNAMYLLGDDWEQLTQLSRTQLLTTPGMRFERIIHRGSWMDRTRTLLLRRLRDEDGPEPENPAAPPIAV